MSALKYTTTLSSDIQPLRILHLISLRQVGGIERLYTEFINFRYPDQPLEHHTLLAKRNIAPMLKKNMQKGSASVHYINYYRQLKIPKWFPLLRQLNIFRITKKIRPHILLLWSKPRIIDSRLFPDFTKVIFFEHGVSWIKDDKAYMQAFFRTIDAAICVSLAAKRMIELKWEVYLDTNIKICRNAVRPDCIPDVTGVKRLALGTPFIIGCAGRIISIKGFVIAIHAVDRLKKKGVKCELRIAGEGEELHRLKSLVRKLDLEHEVKFLGLVGDMKDFFSSISCFVCPSVRESFGMVCAEAMIHGCPVIASAIDGLPEVVEDGVNGFCIPPSLTIKDYIELGGTTAGLPSVVYNPSTDVLELPRIVDPSHLANRIETLATNPAIYEAMSMAALKTAKQKFDFKKQAACIAGFLNKIVKC